MTRIVNGRVVSDEEYQTSLGPIGHVMKVIRQIIAFIQLFFQSIFNPQSLTSTYRRDNRGPGGGGGPKRPTMIHRIRPAENCRAGS